MEQSGDMDMAPVDMDLAYVNLLWRGLAVQLDNFDSMLRLPLADYLQLGNVGRAFLLTSARNAFSAEDVAFFADVNNVERVTLVSRSRVLARGYQVQNLFTSNLPTLIPPQSDHSTRIPHMPSQSHDSSALMPEE
ncbi:hypothetical protein GGR56DRAFT_459649 [Xylariaceae sp. FL0804]|nr:hypothetical protein GGR56DRAFT_459649 [Xylariaceae sp. FL0804]